MVYIDWNQISAITPETFSEDEKEELINSVVWYTPTSDVTRKQLSALLKVLQEITKYKADQVESLMSALDELAAKQGEEVARARQELLDELEDLKEQLEYQQRLEGEDGATEDELKSEVVRLQMQNEQLLQELQDREKDIVAEKAEAETYASQVARLEREKSLLANELTALQEEADMNRGQGALESPDGGTEKIEELVELVRQKNKHIFQLLNDIEEIEQSNQTLRVRSKTMQDELAEANKAIIDLTEKISGMNVIVDDAEKKMMENEERNKALESQLAELMELKAKHDRDLDEFAITLNSRVEEWKKLMDLKDAEILAVRDELNLYVSKSNVWSENSNDPRIKIKMEQIEQENVILKTELEEVTIERDNYCLEIEDLKKEIKILADTNTFSDKINALEDEIVNLKSQLTEAEEDVTAKAEEINKLVIRVREFERGEFGLSEAMDQLKKLELKVNKRDQKIENLVATCNEFEIEKGNLEDENTYLREKLNLSPNHIIDSALVKKTLNKDAQTVASLRDEVEMLKEQIVQLKLRNRELSGKLETEGQQRKLPEDPSKDDNIKSISNVYEKKVEEFEGKYLNIVSENDALRKGMHEILESVKSRSTGSLQIDSLERLLEALDARHVSGWYHPAMRLQAQLNKVQGECSELRNQLRTLTDENIELKQERDEGNRKVEGLEEGISEKESRNAEEENVKGSLQEKELEEAENRCLELKLLLNEMEMTHQKLEAEWDTKKCDLLRERDDLVMKLSTYSRITDSMVDAEDKIVDFVLARKNALEEAMKHLKYEFIQKQEEQIVRIIELQKDNSRLMQQVRSLEKSMMNLEPYEKVATLQNELSQLRREHGIALNLNIKNIEHSSNSIMLESSHWESEKRSMLDEMRSLKEKCYEMQTLLQGDHNEMPDELKNELSILASKLAASEVREFAEKQKRMHLEKLVDLLKAERTEIEVREKDLSSQVDDQIILNEKLQRILIDVGFDIQKATLTLSEDKNEDLKAAYGKLVNDKKYVEELLEISRNQCRALQNCTDFKKMEQDAFTECVALLRTTGNEKFSLATLSQELVLARESEKILQERLSEYQTLVPRILAENLEKESQLSQVRIEARNDKQKCLNQFKIVYKHLSEIHSAFNGAILYPSIGRANAIIRDLVEKQENVDNILQEIKVKEKQINLKEEEIGIELDAIYDLKSAFQSDTKALIDWHNKSTELRLRETRFKRENEYLLKEIVRKDTIIKKAKEDIQCIETKTLENEREWELKQLKWERFQVELCELVEGKGDILKTYILDEESKEVDTKVDSIMETEDTNEIKTSEIIKMEEVGDNTEQPKTTTCEKCATTIKVHLEKSKYLGSERAALKVTAQSLQSIIEKKEETLNRCRNLLKKNREDHENAIRLLQKELKNVHNAMALQSKACSRLKHGQYQTGPTVIEEYDGKIHELEEELAEAQSNLTRAANQLRSSQQDVETWRDLAEKRLVLIEDTKERLEGELYRCQEEIQSYQSEALHLRELLEGGQSQKLLITIQELQNKLTLFGDHPASSRANENDLIERLKLKLKSSQEECEKLKEHIKSIPNPRKRPIMKRNDNQDVNLVDKIKALEEMVKLSKQHQQELEENGLKKIRSAEEVTRWDERKRHQKSLERLQARLKQKEVEANIANQKLETLRGLMAKMERDRNILEIQLKNVTDSARESSRMEKVLAEKAALMEEVAALQEELSELQRYQDGEAVAMLHAKLSEQERKIANFELSTKAQSTRAADLDRIKATSLPLERENTRLKKEISKLELTLEKTRMDNQYLQNKYRQIESNSRSSTESANLNIPQSRAQIRMAYDSKREVNRLKAELAAVQEQLTSVTEKNQNLEEEIRRLHTQISLWEEKDMADSITKSNHEYALTELHQEIIQLKEQLAQKNHLLQKVKVLLKKAVNKEKILNEKVATLQTMVGKGPMSV